MNVVLMKSPQTEDGFTRIANELFDAILGANLTGAQQVVVFAIVRKTYGYNKKTDDVSASQIGKLCGMAREQVTRALNELAKYNVITKSPGVHGSIIGIQKDYSKWNIPSKKESPSDKSSQVEQIVTGVTILPFASDKSSQVDSDESSHTKDNLTKDNKQKKARAETTLATFLESCKAQETKPIPENDKVFEYADKAKIPHEFLRLHWLLFKDRYTDVDKRYKDWRDVFRRSVKGNWMKVWFIDGQGNYSLTTVGLQAQKALANG